MPLRISSSSFMVTSVDKSAALSSVAKVALGVTSAGGGAFFILLKTMCFNAASAAAVLAAGLLLPIRIFLNYNRHQSKQGAVALPLPTCS